MSRHGSSVVTASQPQDRLEVEGPGHKRADLLGWLAVAALTLAVAATWAPMVGTAFGDNHEGRVMARYALHMRNLAEDGFVGSNWSTSMEPYSSSYAHHPPLPNILDAVVSLLPGDGEYQIRLAPYLLGLLAIPAAAALLRAFRIRWAPILLSLGLMVVTGFYWFYGRIVVDLGPLIAMSAAIAHLRRREHPSVGLIVIACVAAIIGVLSSWLGIAGAAVLGLWLLTKRGIDRATVAVGLSMVIGVAVSLAFIVGLSGASNLVGQTQFRTSGGEFSGREFVDRQWLWLRSLLPSWYLALLPVGMLAGLLNRRTRFYTAFSAVLACGWVLALPNGSYIHDYWPYPVLVPGVVGMAALFDWVWRIWRPAGAIAATAAGGLLVVAFVNLVTGPTAEAYLAQSTRAGELVREHGAAPGQQQAWFLGLGTVRWLAYYWDLPTASVTEGASRTADPDDLVLVRLDRVPHWAPEDLSDRVTDRDERYALVRMRDLHER
jgi:hypothetical protein